MECSATFIPPVHVIKLGGDWNAHAAPVFEEFCEELGRREQLRFIVLDLTEVDYVSSFGLRTLLNLAKALQPCGGRIHVAGLSVDVRKVFDGSGFSSLFPEFETADAAREAFQGSDDPAGK